MKRKKIFQLICCIVLLASVSSALFSCADAGGETVNVGTERNDGVISFSADDDAAAAANSNYVFLAGKREIQIFSDKGKRVYYKQTQLNDPEVLVNGSCFLVYDKNGSSCFLFRNEKCLAELQPEYPIYAAYLDSSGMFVLLTRTYASASAACLYDASGTLKKIIERTDYAVDCAITAGGKLILLTIDAVGGEWVTSVASYKSGATEPAWEKTFKGVYPYTCTVKNNRVAVACSGGVYLLDRKGKTTCIDAGNTALYSIVLQSNGRTVYSDGETLVTIDVRGRKQEFSLPFTSVENAVLYGDCLFLSSGRTIAGMNMKNGSVSIGTAAEDFDNVVLKNTTQQIYLKTASSLVPYDVKNK